MVNSIGKARRKKLVSEFLKYYCYTKIKMHYLVINWNFSYFIMHRFTTFFFLLFNRFESCRVGIYVLTIHNLNVYNIIFFFSIVWYFNDCLRCECNRKTLGSST